MDWLKSLRRWIKRIFRKKTKANPSPKIIKRWYGDNCSVFKIQRDTPGERATYRVIAMQGDYDLLLTLDYLRELQVELAGDFNGIPFKLRPIPNPNAQLTHRFSVWRIWRNGRISPVGIWDCDLEGYASYSIRQIAPNRAILGVALRSLKIPHSLKTPDLTWQSQCDRINWLGLIEEKIRQELQNPYHSLKAIAIVRTY